FRNTPRAPASRLWNPINSSPRAPVLPNVPVAHPQLVEGPPLRSEGRDAYPLLTLPEQLQSRTSGIQSSLNVEHSAGGGTGSNRTSVGFPGNRRSRGPEEPSMMEQAAAKAAGMEEAQPEGPLAPNPSDTEAGNRLQHQASRASLPLQTLASRRQSTIGTDVHDTSSQIAEEDEYAWGPAHPCFPHLNPHVPLSSPLYSTTRIIRVRRDWMLQGDLAPTFANLYPEVLDPHMSEETFRAIIAKANDELVAAFSPWSPRAWADSLLGIATLWLWEDFGLTGVKKRLRDLEVWIEDWNRTVGEKEGVLIIPLRRTGYLTLDIQIPDPHIEADT
ncbi:hypothetical protein K490DRAFT_10758, partial [Saccharata proteae CBS 121410]